MEDIAEPWDEAESIMDYTDTDLQYMRDYSTRVHDPEFEIHRMTETLLRQLELENWSDTMDTALRVELASIFDNESPNLTRDQFDVGYMIPPQGWVSQQQFNETELVSEDEVDTSDPFISYSAPTECRDMMERMIEEGVYDKKKEFVIAGLKRMLGR